MANEKAITNKIIKRLREEPESWWQKLHGGPYQAGLPDIIGCVSGKLVAFEVKDPTGNHKVTPRQEITLSAIERAGGYSAVVYSVDDALDYLESWGLTTSAESN